MVKERQMQGKGSHLERRNVTRMYMFGAGVTVTMSSTIQLPEDQLIELLLQLRVSLESLCETHSQRSSQKTPRTRPRQS
jgi:hypothetical protein